MSQTPTAAVLSTAAEEVLETMFFLCSGAKAPHAKPPGPNESQPHSISTARDRALFASASHLRRRETWRRDFSA